MNEFDENIGVIPNDWLAQSDMIKVIGVGGGGCNAVSYMYRENVQGCSFIVCNTDSQALAKSDVPVKIQLGEGLGAGTDPAEGRKAALESQDRIEKVLFTDGLQMLFITAGMGGGTGTGAAPVIAKMSKDRGILTVGVVTVPFDNEGNNSLSKAVDGIRELEKNVDSLLIIKNQKLYEFYGSLLVQDAFPKSDEVLATAVRGITEIISQPGYINVDFKDIRNMMRGSGCALMGTGIGSGKDRIEQAVCGAFDSPLLNDYDVSTAKNVLINITVGKNEQGLKMDELEKINRRIKDFTGNANNFKSGLVWLEDPDFGDKIRITAIATGLRFSEIMGPVEDLGNYIFIDSEFEYSRLKEDCSEGISLPENDSRKMKIGYNTRENCRTFHFGDEKTPALCIRDGQDKSRLEGIPAIRRTVRNEKKQQ